MTSETISAGDGRSVASGRKLFLYLFWTGVGLAIVVALFVFSGLSVADLGAIVVAIPLWFYAVMACLQVAILMMASVKWQIVLGQFPVGGKVLPLGDALAGTTLGALAGHVLPIQLVTPMTRAWVARPHQISTARAVGTSVFEQVPEVVVLLAMGLASTLVLVAQLGPVESGIAALAVGLIVISLIAPIFRLLCHFSNWASGHLPEMVANVTAIIVRALDQAASFPKRVFFQLLGFSFLRYISMVVLNVGAISVLVPDADVHSLALVYPLVLLIISLPFIPGGLGVLEVTWTGVLVGQGLGAVEAVEVALSLRVITTISFLAISPILILFRTSAAELK